MSASRKTLSHNGWAFEGSHLHAGELALRARRDDVEMLVEMGQSGELMELEMELYEPLSSQPPADPP